MELQLKREHFINHYPPFNLFKSGETDKMFAKKPVHLYVHLPFCPAKCKYCYYKSFDDRSPGTIAAYIEDLKREIAMYSRQPEVKNKIVKTLYFGGGTPTFLNYAQYTGLVKFIYDHFDMDPGLEFCSEARPSPRAMSIEKLHMLKEMKVNRISFGVQNLSNEILRLNGRDATVEYFYDIFRQARAMEFEKINVDIMSGMLGENWENWESVISQLLHLEPESIAFYKMELFFNTKLFNEIRRKRHEGKVMSNDEEIEFIRRAHKRLEQEGGYIQANCLHHIKDEKYDHDHVVGLWGGEDMRAFGITAHSCCDDFFFQNTPDIDEYHRVIEAGRLPVKRSHRMTMKDIISRAMVYGIKMLKIDRNAFARRYGFDMTEIYGNEIQTLVNGGILELDEDQLRVTPQYRIFADDICRVFFLPQYKSMMTAHMKRN